MTRVPALSSLRANPGLEGLLELHAHAAALVRELDQHIIHEQLRRSWAASPELRRWAAGYRKAKEGSGR